MRTYTKFREYIWLVNTIMRSGSGLTFAEIQQRWLDTDMSEGVELARTTFNRHKAAIEEMFGIFIDCEKRRGYRYVIGNKRVLTDNSVQNWMLSTLTVNNLVSESLSLQHRILLENIPTQGEMLGTVLEAMKKKVKLAVDYRRYGREEARHMEIEPYCIKLCKQRWYVLAHFHYAATETKPEKDYYAMFSLDRMESLALTGERFDVPAEFDAKDFFRECYGVVAGDGTPCEHVVVRAYEPLFYYLRDLPLHESQQEAGKGKGYADFAFDIRPTVDFCQYLMSQGAGLKVLQPAWLAQKIKDMHLEAAKMYEE